MGADEPTSVNAVAICTELGNEDNVTAAIVVERVARVVDVVDEVVEVLVVEEGCGVGVLDVDTTGVEESCVDEVAGGATLVEDGEAKDDEGATAFEPAGAVDALLTVVDEPGGVPVMIVVPLCESE